MNGRHIAFRVVILNLALAIATGCTAKKQEQPSAAVSIHGAGSTFVEPLFRKWLEQYQEEHPGVTIKYEAVGSGEGTRRFLANSVDFAASDAALTDTEIASVQRGAVLIPVTAGSIVIAYNPEGMPEQMKLSRSVYADIFLGKITRWNDERIASINPEVTLPDRDIQVVVRQDSSGTTFAFTKHLSAVSEEWRNGPGESKSISGPQHTSAANGNNGLASSILRGNGTIGYVEYGTAKRVGLGMAWLENKAGNYIKPSGSSGLEALLHTKMPENMRLFIPDPDGEDSYPIVTYSWFLMYGKYDNPKTLDALHDIVRWCLEDGQQYSENLGYIRLAPRVVVAATRSLESFANR